MSDPKPWRVLASRIVHADRWIRLRADTCETDEGTRIDPYYVIEAGDWVQVVALTDACEVVTIRLYRHGAAAVSHELPSGQIDDGEEPLAGGQRELLEETGFGAREWRLLPALPANSARQRTLAHIVLALGAERIADPADDPTERVAVQLVPAAEAVRMARAGELTQGLHVAALALALTELGLWESG